MKQEEKDFYGGVFEYAYVIFNDTCNKQKCVGYSCEEYCWLEFPLGKLCSHNNTNFPFNPSIFDISFENKFQL